MSILSTSIYGSSTGKGVGGLLSGLDTDDLVKQMTAGTRRKIDRQYQSKQKLLYRQEAYREVSTKLLAFSNKYFSRSSGSQTNILDPSFFEAYTFKSSSNYVNVTGNPENIKNLQITEISNVATTAKFVSKNNASAGNFSTVDTIPSNISRLAGETFSISVPNDKVYNFTIDKDFTASTETEVKDKLNDLIAKQLTSDIAANIKFNVKTEGSEFRFEIDGGGTLVAASNEFLDVIKMKVAGNNSGGMVGELMSSIELTRSQEDILKNGSEYITFEYNGILRQINLKKTPEITSIQDLSNHLQSELDKAFGGGKIKVDNITDPNKITFSTTGTKDIFGINSISKELRKLTGLESGDYNRISINRDIDDDKSGIKAPLTTGTAKNDDGEDVYKINVNDKVIEIAKGSTLNDIIKKINNETDVKVFYSSVTDTFSAVSKETGAHTKVSIKDVDGGNLAEALFGTAADQTITNGTDTTLKYKLNGIETEITRSTANISIDGVNIELNEKAKELKTTDYPITFDAINNSDEDVERVKKFIEEYNGIVELIGTKTKEKPKGDYPPLTPEQQDDMKEDEIKNWNEEAKKGILYGDRKINSALQGLKSAASSITDVSALTLASIGISSARMDTSGKLVLDEKKFKEMFLENPDEIKNLFTGVSSKGDDGISGIAVELKKVLVKNVGEYGNAGTLIDEAGLPGMTADKNFISEKIKGHDDKMKTLKKTLEAERKRYWNQFAALENSLNKLNAQSSWLTDMMGN